MDIIENQLLTAFALFNWTAIYQPFVICLRSEEITPTFYIPAIRLFVHCGSDLLRFNELMRMICWGEGWRFLPNCPRPLLGETLQLRDLLQQPAMIYLNPKAEIVFDQFREMPGSPSSSGLLNIHRCESCKEWSPQPGYSASICRFCGQRTANSASVILALGPLDDTRGIRLINMDGESFILPEKDEMFKLSNFTIENHLNKPIPLPGKTVWGAFERLVAGEVAPCSLQSPPAPSA